MQDITRAGMKRTAVTQSAEIATESYTGRNHSLVLLLPWAQLNVHQTRAMLPTAFQWGRC